MKSRTSFFNGRVLGKDLTRFAPLWVLYTVAHVLGLMSINLSSPGNLASDLMYVMGSVSIFHMIYAFLAAACLFGDLFDSRLCSGLHAMPLRREGWFFTHLVSGLLFALVPMVVGAIFGCILLKKFWWMALLWLASSLLQYLFFFGLAVFSALCAGKRLGMAAIYAMFNFLSMLIYWVAQLVYEPLLQGVVLSTSGFELFSPVVTISGHTYVDFHYDKILGGFPKGFEPEAWNYLYLCAALGLGFLALALVLYRKRDLETAGDFISFRPMRYFFLVAYTFTAGTLLYSFNYIFGTNLRGYFFLAVGSVIGWFTGWMLLERNIKIFTRKTCLGFAVFAAVFALSLGITRLDPLGITTYIPGAEQVEAASLYTNSSVHHYEFQDDPRGRYEREPAEIARVQQLHRQMIETPKQEGESVRVTVRYQLKNGKLVRRVYDVPAATQTAEDLSRYLSDVRTLFATNRWEEERETVDYVWVYPNDMVKEEEIIAVKDPAQIDALLDAIAADCQAGTMAQDYSFHRYESPVANVDINWTHISEDGKGRFTTGTVVMVFENCENTIAWLESMGVN